MSVELTGLQKAAVVLLQIGRERAARVLQRMSEPEIEAITAELMRLEHVDQSVADQVLNEFHHVAVVGAGIAGGGVGYAQGLLEESLGQDRAHEMLERINTARAGAPFEFLQHADPRQVLSLLTGEHEQTIALVLAHMRPDVASSILAGLTPGVQKDVTYRIATMERALPDVVSVVAGLLQNKASTVFSPQEMSAVGGVQPLVEIINRADPGTEKTILEGLDERDAELAEEVRSRMFVFADIVLLEDRAVQLVLRQVDINNLAVALKGANEVVKTKIEKNLSERARENLTEELELLPPTRMSQIEEARATIVQTIRRLEEAGDIVVRREGDDELI